MSHQVRFALDSPSHSSDMLSVASDHWREEREDFEYPHAPPFTYQKQQWGPAFESRPRVSRLSLSSDPRLATNLPPLDPPSSTPRNPNEIPQALEPITVYAGDADTAEMALRQRPRFLSYQTAESVTMLDRNDPDITHAGTNRLDLMQDGQDPNTTSEADIPSLVRESAERHRRHYIVMLARSYLAYGTPSHRIETQLASAAKALDIHADFLLIPNTIFACFYDPKEHRQASMHVIKVVGRLSLAAVEDAWTIYLDVNSSRITAEAGAERLKDIEDREETQKKRYKCVLAFLCGLAVTPLAFDGSTADALVGGACAAGTVLIAEYFADRNVLVEKLFEVFVAFFISFIARSLYLLWDHRFCYSAVASGGIVLILPGFTVMCASLELSHKKMLTGSIKLVYAIFFTMILAFVQTSGSDLYLKFNSSAVAARTRMIQSITQTEYLNGSLVANGTLSISNLTLGFTQALDPDKSYAEWKYKGSGCYRDPEWIWVFQKPELEYFFLIVPAFAFFLTLWNGMPVKFRWRNTEHIIMMVLLACASFTANRVGTTYLTGSIGSSLGAFAVSFLGSIYTRFRKDITPFVLMTPGILLLVPTGLTAVGGLSKNYSGDDDQFSSVLNTGLAMVELSIGIIVGLSLASLLASLDEVWQSAMGTLKTEKVTIAF